MIVLQALIVIGLVFFHGLPCLAIDENVREKLVFAGINLGYGSKAGFMCLNRGNPLAQTALQLQSHHAVNADLLLTPTKDVVIALPFGKLTVPEGSVLYVIDTGSYVGLFDLHDNASRPIIYRDKERTFLLTPGTMIVTSENADKSYEQVPAQFKQLPVRHVVLVARDDQHSVFHGGFSITGALTQIQKLKELRISNDSEDRKLYKRLMKMAAVQQVVSAAHGPFSSNGRQ